MHITRRLLQLYSWLFLAWLPLMPACSKNAGEKEDNYVPPPAVPGQWRMIIKKMPDQYHFEVGSGHNPNTFSIGEAAYWMKGRQLIAYTPADNSFAIKASFPGEERQVEVFFTIGGKGYAGMGYKNDMYGAFTYYNDFWEYDPAQDKWTRKKDFPYQQFSAPFAIGAGQKGYVGSGTIQGYTKNEIFEYDPAADGWKLVSYPPFDLNGHVCFSLNGKIYLGSKTSNILNELDPVTKKWKSLADGPPKGAVSVATGSTAYAFLDAYLTGSYNTPVYPDIVARYDPSNNTWNSIAKFTGGGRFYTVRFAVGDKIYLGLGAKPNPSSPSTTIGMLSQHDLWEYTP